MGPSCYTRFSGAGIGPQIQGRQGEGDRAVTFKPCAGEDFRAAPEAKGNAEAGGPTRGGAPEPRERDRSSFRFFLKLFLWRVNFPLESA